MNTKPILFSTEMVQAILADRKTQTRRTKGLNEINLLPSAHTFKYFSLDEDFAIFKITDELQEIADVPYRIGDILWVRETFTFNPIGKTPYLYKADSLVPKFIKWKPSIHMPKEACRLFLKITNVRVQRLKDIDRKDSFAEGCHFPDWSKEDDPQIWFYELWERINGKESLESNPWVWVIEFEKVEKPENF